MISSGKCTSRFQAEGIPNDPRLTILRNNEKYLASTVQQQEQIKEFTRLAEKGALTEGMVFRSTLDPEQKKQLYRQITSGAVPKIDKETNRRAKEYIKGRLLESVLKVKDISLIHLKLRVMLIELLILHYKNFSEITYNLLEVLMVRIHIKLLLVSLRLSITLRMVFTLRTAMMTSLKMVVDVKLKGTFKNNDFTVKPNYQAATAPEETLADAYERYGDKDYFFCWSST